MRAPSRSGRPALALCCWVSLLRILQLFIALRVSSSLLIQIAVTRTGPQLRGGGSRGSRRKERQRVRAHAAGGDAIQALYAQLSCMAHFQADGRRISR